VDFLTGFWVALLTLFAFFLVNFFYTMAKYPERTLVPSGELLRLASSVWAFLLYCATGFSHWTAMRIRAPRLTT
jgi:hypothetical protein